MTRVISTHRDLLRPFVAGKGVQFFADSEALLPGIPLQPQSGTLAADDGRLDFVIAGPEWWTHENPVALASEWRRCLRNGGRLAAVVQASAGQRRAIERFLATECGISIEGAREVEPGTWLITGTRATTAALRRLFTSAGSELARHDKPDGWRAELYFDLATALLQGGEGRRAAECYGIVLSEDPSSVDARVGLALAMASQADWDEARQILREVLRTDPDHGLAAEWLDRCQRHAASVDTGDSSVLRPAAPRRVR